MFGKALGVGAGCVAALIGWSLVLGKRLALEDFLFLATALFAAGIIISFVGQVIAGKATGSFLGAFGGLWGAALLAELLADPDAPTARLATPAAGFVLGAVIGAWLERSLRRGRFSRGVEDDEVPL